MRQTGLPELVGVHLSSTLWLSSNVRKFQQLLLMFSSVYLSRSLRSDKFSCIAWPFNLVEFALIFALSTQNGVDTVAKSVEPMFEMVKQFYMLDMFIS